MSIPRQNTVWGKFLFENQELGVLGGRHLNETTKNTINEYMKGRKPFVCSPFAPWVNNRPKWEIEDGKLYLTDIGLSVDMSEDYTVEYKGKERIETIEGPGGEIRELRTGRTKIISSSDDRSNMQKIFGVDRLFAEWIDEPMKLLARKSKQKPVTVNKGKDNEKTHYEVTMDLLVLDFKQGILKGSEREQETYKALRNYIEELESEEYDDKAK